MPATDGDTPLYNEEAVTADSNDTEEGTEKSHLAQGDIVAGYYKEAHTHPYSGYIEPEDRSWIVFLGPDGKPSMYWRERSDTGAVIGDPLIL